MQIKNRDIKFLTKLLKLKGMIPINIGEENKATRSFICCEKVNHFERLLSFPPPNNSMLLYTPKRNEWYDHQKTFNRMFIVVFFIRLPGGHCRHYLIHLDDIPTL